MFIPNKKDLPVLIHGKEGSGASLFSIRLIASFAKDGNSVTFWSAYPMAKAEFRKELDERVSPNTIIESEDPMVLSKILLEVDVEETLFVKNFEVVPREIRERLLERKNLIISGDMENILNEDQILKFPTRIFFSPFYGMDIPPLKKYKGFLVSKDKNELVSI